MFCCPGILILNSQYIFSPPAFQPSSHGFLLITGTQRRARYTQAWLLTVWHSSLKCVMTGCNEEWVAAVWHDSLWCGLTRHSVAWLNRQKRTGFAREVRTDYTVEKISSWKIPLFSCAHLREFGLLTYVTLTNLTFDSQKFLFKILDIFVLLCSTRYGQTGDFCDDFSGSTDFGRRSFNNFHESFPGREFFFIHGHWTNIAIY